MEGCIKGNKWMGDGFVGLSPRAVLALENMVPLLVGGFWKDIIFFSFSP